MEIKEIRQIVKLMVENDLTELAMEAGPDKISIKRGPGDIPVMAMSPVAAAPAADVAASVPEGEVESSDDTIEIKSPMVGTFYVASGPEDEPFVAIGDAVNADTVVCIIEAMKVMNEIKADCSGAVAEICVSNSQPVEFGQVLFRVKPL